MEDRYTEIETTIQDLQDGDLVFGTDGEWHEIKVLPIQEKGLYVVDTEYGAVICSFDHQWNLYDEGFVGTYSTIEIYNDSIRFKDMRIGENNGPKILSIKELEEGECRCIEVDSDDHQFQILTDEGERIFTHNCQGRAVCGRVDTTASLMALGNTLATGIPGDIKGRGIVSANGIMSNLQIYFESPEWIDKWYMDRGFDPLGYPPDRLEEDEILLGDNEEEIRIEDSLVEIDFEGVHKEINNAKKQQFDNI